MLFINIKPFIKGYVWEVEFCHSVISDLTNDYKVRSYAFVQDFLNYRTNYHRIIDSSTQASFKTNFTVVGDSETGYEVCDVIVFRKGTVLLFFTFWDHLILFLALTKHLNFNSHFLINNKIVIVIRQRDWRLRYES